MPASTARGSSGPVATTRVSAETTLRMRRPPSEYITLLSQNEQEFRTFVDSFEKDPLFRNLVDTGAILPVRLRGKIPREKYEEFMDEGFLGFLRDYDIISHDRWEQDFLSPHAMDRVTELATKYKVPLSEMIRQLRYIRSSRNGLPSPRAAKSESSNGHSATIDNAPGLEMVDLAEVIETTRQFVQRYSVSEQDFLDLILGSEATPERLAERLGCSLREAEEVLDAADRVYLAENYESSHQPAAQKKSASSRSAAAPDEAVAFIHVVDGQPSLQFHFDSVYTQRYHIKTDLLRKVAEENGVPPSAQELIMRARFINQRLSALSRLITTLCDEQSAYLATGDMYQLKPLAQAELSRRLGEHPSTVSRLIRGKIVETPWGRIPLLFLCQSKTEVVARLIGKYPDLTDQEVVSRLREEYDCFIARRTVAYHRGKRLRRNKRRQQKPEQAEAANGKDSPVVSTTGH